jgi:hypothetical protein
VSTINAPTTTGKTRAEWPGSSPARRAVFVGVAVVLLGALSYGIYGLTATHGPDVANPASWLPKQQLDHPVDQMLLGTVRSPALAVAGGLVDVRTSTFSAQAEINGPVVPGEGLPDQMAYTTCTWTFSIDHVVGRVPIALRDFDTINHLGTLFKLSLVPGQHALPSMLSTGQHLTFELRAVMPTGEGLLRWAPDGNNIVAKWDYQVEND